MTQTVFLLHGIARTHRCMRPLARFLAEHGFTPVNLDYPSTRHGLLDLVNILHPRIAAVTDTSDTPVHFVGYSMGGLLIRAYLQARRPACLGRVVMLGTPNRGSAVADRLQRLWLYRRFYGPAGQQLVTDQSTFAHLLGPADQPVDHPVDYPVGVIAGNRPFDPVGSWLLGRGKDDTANDGKVSVASTRLAGMRDHIVLPVDHTTMPGNRRVMQQTLHFLHHGVFQHAEP